MNIFDLSNYLVTECNFFLNRTGIPLFDNCLENPEYFEKNKNMKCYIKQMTPDEYFIESAKMHRISIDREYKRLNRDIVEEIKKAMKRGKMFYIPFLDYTIEAQEGAHRVKAAQELGCITIPVLIVERVID